MSARPRSTPRPKPASVATSRLLPLSIAGVVCFLLALVLGYSGWYLFGTHRGDASTNDPAIVQTPSVNAPAAANMPPAQAEEPPRILRAPAGELPVPGGVVVLGGEGTEQPLRRETIEPFSVAETEVTNEQYGEFVKATGHKAPASWQNNEYAPGMQNDPVVNVTWQDVADYCAWLSQKTGATIRLPMEKEWVLAAGGADNFKYPWGNEWNPRAANYKATGVGVRPVKSYAEGKSPCGAYDMAGNVWEWVSDDARDKNDQLKETKGVKRKIIKGGSAVAKPDYLMTTARFDLPLDEANPVVGFRYVVIRNGNAVPSSSP